MKKTVIEIRTKDGIAKVNGYVEGDFGFHKDADAWKVTHLASGLGCGVTAKTRKQAESLVPQVVDALSKLDKAKLNKRIEEFNELRGIKTKKVSTKASKGDKKMAKKTTKKETQKDVIARLEKENAELKARLKTLEEPENTGIETFDVESYLASRDNEHRITPELIKALEETKGLKVHFEGKNRKVVKKFTGSEWLCVEGETAEDTKSRKEIFKAMGFRFRGADGSWFLAPYPLKSPKRYSKSNSKSAVA